MAILTSLIVGQTGISPALARLNAPTNTIAQIIVAGFLNNHTDNYGFLNTGDFVFAICSDGNAQFVVTKSNGLITLSPFSNTGEVSLIGAAVAGNLPQFANTSGDIEDSGIGADTVVEYVGLSQGVTGNIALIADLDGNIDTGPVSAARVLTSSFNTPDTNLNMIYVSVSNVTFTQLNSGTVVIFTPTGSKTYQLMSMFTQGGTSFSGGGGDRNLMVFTSANNQALLTAAAAQLLGTNAYMAGDGVNFPIQRTFGAAISNANPLSITYNAGTTNYSAGLVSLGLLLVRLS